MAYTIADLMGDEWGKRDICFNCQHCKIARNRHVCAITSDAVPLSAVRCYYYKRSAAPDVRAREADAAKEPRRRRKAAMGVGAPDGD